MFSNYIKIAWRNLFSNKLSSFINIAGLAAGMAITIIIGLWIWDEVSFNKYHQHYDRIGQLWQFVKFDAVKSSYNSLPQPLARELRATYPDIEKVSLTTFSRDAIFKYNDVLISKKGMFVESDFPEIMSFKMLKGDGNSLADPSSILISSSLAGILFSNTEAIGQFIKINNKDNLKVVGIYEDIPANSSFYGVDYLAPWANFIMNDPYAKNAVTGWDENSWPIYVQLRENADFGQLSAAIKDIRMNKENPPAYKPEFFVHPMSKWHLRGEFYDGQNTGGLIQLVWMFGIVGLFVLLLACVNFMNLSTARSEKRAREVGIRKTIGSLKSQLVAQFYTESVLMSGLAMILSVVLVFLLLPYFNHIADKKMSILWSSGAFWAAIVSFSILTSIIAGSYPAFYLSHFQPIKVLKGLTGSGSFAVISRKSLVVFQYVVSIVLIIGTIIVYKQLNFAKDRPRGYDDNQLVEVKMITRDLYGHYDALRNDLIQSGGSVEMSESMGSITEEFGGTTDINWKAKPVGSKPLFIWNRGTHDLGKTIGWNILQGRDFSRTYNDSASVILNQSALKSMNLSDPLNELIVLGGKNFQIIGVVDDVIKFDPFQPVNPYVFTIDYNSATIVNLRLSPKLGTAESLARIENVFKKYAPSVPFSYTFVDENFAQKFSTNAKIGKLSIIFSILAIFISCLGIFGLAAFVAEKRTKEIGVRKVLGASIYSVWSLLSEDFIILSLISMVIAFPVSYTLMHHWLEGYTLRVTITADLFVYTAIGILFITILTVSFQAVKAAVANPVRSLRTD